MKEIGMTKKEIQEEIEFEDKCGVNTLLQNLIYYKDTVDVFMIIDNKGINRGYRIRDKKTHKDVQL